MTVQQQSLTEKTGWCAFRKPTSIMTGHELHLGLIIDPLAANELVIKPKYRT
jgi:hypothetical protein